MSVIFSKKSLFVTLALVSACLIISYTPQSNQSSQNLVASPKVLKIAYSQNVGALNPQGYNKNAMFAQNLLYEGLLKADKNGAIIPSLATSFALDTSGKVYIFSLRKGVRFSNGEEFNADAVVLNFASILKNRARHSWSGLARALERVERIDDYTVRLVLKEPYAPTLNELALPRPFRFLAPSAFPPDLDLVAQNPEPIGTGAYMLVESKLGSYDKFAKNPHYWDAKRLEAQGGLYYDEVVVKVIFEPNSKLSALRAGQVDMIYGADEIPIRIFQEIRNEEVRNAVAQGLGAEDEVVQNGGKVAKNAGGNEGAQNDSAGNAGKVSGAQGDSGKSPKFRAYLGQASFATSLMLNSNRIKQAQIRKAIALSIDKDTLINAVYGTGVSGASGGDNGKIGASGKSDKSGGVDCSVDYGENPSDESGASPASPATNTVSSPIASVAESIFVHTSIVPPSLADDNRTTSPSLATNTPNHATNTPPQTPPARGGAFLPIPNTSGAIGQGDSPSLAEGARGWVETKPKDSPAQLQTRQNPNHNPEFKPQNPQSQSPTQKGQNQNPQNQAQPSQPTQSKQNLTTQNHTSQKEQNVAKAREILSSFGYTQQNPLKLELFFFGDKPSQKMLAQILQSQLKEANIALSVRGLEPSMYANALRKGEFDMAFVDSWGAPYEPLSQLYSYTKPLGHGDYIAQSALKEKPRIDALILQAIKESASVANSAQNPQNLGQNHSTNPARNGTQNPAINSPQNPAHKSRAQALSDEAIELLIQSGVYIPLLIERSKAVAHSRIRGVEGVSSLSYEIPIWDFYE